MSFKLDKIQMIEASCLSFSVNNKDADNILGFTFDYTAQSKADSINKLIFVQLNISINASLQEGKKNNFASFEFGFTYKVENLEELIQIIDEHKSLDKTLHMSLLGIAFSTARGMILTRGANTILKDAYLPIVNPSALLNPEFVN